MPTNTLAAWDAAMSAAGLQATEYLRQHPSDELMPWAHIQSGSLPCR
jgi:hypothetical protein